MELKKNSMRKNKKKTICFDIDNTICITKSNNYKQSKPIKKKVNLINILYKKGFHIKLFTSRFMGRNKENKTLAKQKGYRLTKSQLTKWGLKYHELIFGKPSFDIYIDDKNLEFKNNWPKILKKKLKLLNIK